MRIPLDTAHSILGTFGITKPTPAYNRWVKADGFDADDFMTVLCDSPFLFVLDWRGAVDEDLQPVREALSKLRVVFSLVFVDSEHPAGTAECEGRQAAIHYAPHDETTSWSQVFEAIQGVVPPHIEFRESVDNGGSDTDIYAVLPDDEWRELDHQAPQVMQYLFRPLGGTHT